MALHFACKGRLRTWWVPRCPLLHQLKRRLGTIDDDQCLSHDCHWTDGSYLRSKHEFFYESLISGNSAGTKHRDLCAWASVTTPTLQALGGPSCSQSGIGFWSWWKRRPIASIGQEKHLDKIQSYESEGDTNRPIQSHCHLTRAILAGR
jgi:hypothetical protein